MPRQVQSQYHDHQLQQWRLNHSERYCAEVPRAPNTARSKVRMFHGTNLYEQLQACAMALYTGKPGSCARHGASTRRGCEPQQS